MNVKIVDTNLVWVIGVPKTDRKNVDLTVQANICKISPNPFEMYSCPYKKQTKKTKEYINVYLFAPTTL